MQSNEQNQDVVVIGGGLAGLAAAALAARNGRRVRLLEQSHEIGGRARTQQQHGFYFNIGPHALYRAGRAIQVLKELGIEPQGGVPNTSGAFAIRGGAKYTFPAGVLSMLTTSLFGLSAKIEAAQVLRSLEKLDADALMHTSVREWAESNITQPSAREFFTAVLRLATYVNDPDRMSAGAAIKQLRMALTKGVLYLDGGWQRLVAALAEKAEGFGVTIERGAKVEMIERAATGEVKAVRLGDGRVYQTPVAVIASSPKAAAAIIEGGAQTSLARWADRLVAVRAACLDVALTSLPKPGATFALGIDQPLYLSVHSASARLAPEGAAMIHVAKYLPTAHSQSPDEVKRELEGALDLIQPGWREQLSHHRFLPDMIVMNAIPAADIGGTQGRPGPEVEDVPGLFVAGDWVGDEGLLADASLASAHKAAERVASYSAASLAARL